MSAAIGLRDDDRGLVPGRDAGRTEERSGLSVGQKGHATAPAKGSALRKCLSFWRSLSGPQYWNAIIMSHADTQAMQKHVDEISRAVAPGAHVLIILDQAAWHTTRKLNLPENLTLVPLPPACPELNAAENIWQYLRQTYLSNRVFENYTAILDACQTAWRSLLNELGRIASIATRQWAYIG